MAPVQEVTHQASREDEISLTKDEGFGWEPHPNPRTPRRGPAALSSQRARIRKSSAGVSFQQGLHHQCWGRMERGLHRPFLSWQEVYVYVGGEMLECALDISEASSFLQPRNMGTASWHMEQHSGIIKKNHLLTLLPASGQLPGARRRKQPLLHLFYCGIWRSTVALKGFSDYMNHLSSPQVRQTGLNVRTRRLCTAQS